MLKKNDSRNQTGMAIRRKVLGDAHVERAEKSVTDFDDAFQELIVEAAWARVWARPDWTLAQRSCVTLALLAAGSHWEEFEMHLRATRNTGATPADVRETLLHVAIYSGVPTANHAFQIAKKVFASMEKGEPAKEQRK
jgi:4-carboxymuconolactone decarboxylase